MITSIAFSDSSSVLHQWPYEYLRRCYQEAEWTWIIIAFWFFRFRICLIVVIDLIGNFFIYVFEMHLLTVSGWSWPDLHSHWCQRLKDHMRKVLWNILRTLLELINMLKRLTSHIRSEFCSYPRITRLCFHALILYLHHHAWYLSF